MATKLRRSLYIGLGGTGINAILKTKKMFIENYGDVPPMIGFLGIDTDENVYGDGLDLIGGGTVSLDPSEKCSISVRGPRAHYNNRRIEGKLDWIPEDNVRHITTLDRGAGQIRTNGRLAFDYNRGGIKRKITEAINVISSNTIIDNDDYEVASGSAPAIYLVFSFCGGTGCGTFIDVAYLIRCSINEELSINGYGVLPDVFLAMNNGPEMARVRQNAYGAILDLDYIVHKTLNSDGIKLPWVQEKTGDKLPFDSMHFIDNTNEDNVIYSNIDDLTSMISLALISAAGDIGSEAMSIGDNTKVAINGGELTVGGKEAWVSTLGVSEVIFRGSIVADLYKAKYAQAVIEKLTSVSGDGNKEANNWIDSPEVNIRENNNEDCLIDTLLKVENRIVAPEVVKYSDAKNEMALYLQSARPKDNVMAQKLERVKNRVLEQLKIKVNKVLNQESGEGNIQLAIDILKDIKRQVAIFMGEMESEQKVLESRTARLKQILDTAVKDLVDLDGKFMLMGKSRKLSVASEDVTIAADKVAMNEWDIIRRSNAIKFFRSLDGAIDDHLSRVTSVKLLLDTLCEEYKHKINIIQNSVGSRSNTVDVDLTEDFVQNIAISKLNVSEFLRIAGDLYVVTQKSMLIDVFNQYGDSLSSVRQWKECSIDDIIGQLNDKSFDAVLDKAIEKAMPMIKYNVCGFADTDIADDEGDGGKLLDSISRVYFVCLPNKDMSRITEENFRRRNKTGVKAQFISTGLNDRIIIYRSEGVVPPFVIDSVKRGETPYLRTPIKYHFDFNIYNDIRLNRFSLMPKIGAEDDEYLVLEMWVKGFIFGLIKYDDSSNTYWLIDKKNGRALDNYWVNTNESYRDRAHSVFINSFSALEDQYNEAIDNIVNEMGQANLKELIVDVKKVDRYYDHYSQINVQKTSLNRREFIETRDLIEKEVDYVNQKLGVE